MLAIVASSLSFQSPSSVVASSKVEPMMASRRELLNVAGAGAFAAAFATAGPALADSNNYYLNDAPKIPESGTGMAKVGETKTKSVGRQAEVDEWGAVAPKTIALGNTQASANYASQGSTLPKEVKDKAMERLMNKK